MSEKAIYVMRPKPHASRQRACEAIMSAPDGYIVTIQPPKRSLEQNAKMWAMLADLSKQVVWYGLKLSNEDWKDVLSSSLRKEIRTVPNVEGNGLVVLGMRTSKMSVRMMNDLIEYMYWFGAEKNVVWSEPEEAK
jgi:hypothetical protein